jgi:hypothetical protein
MYKVPVFLQNTQTINFTEEQAIELKDGVRPICFDRCSDSDKSCLQLCEDKINTIFNQCSECILYGNLCNQVVKNVPINMENLFPTDNGPELGYQRGMTCQQVIQKSRIIKAKLLLMPASN